MTSKSARYLLFTIFIVPAFIILYHCICHLLVLVAILDATPSYPFEDRLVVVRQDLNELYWRIFIQFALEVVIYIIKPLLGLFTEFFSGDDRLEAPRCILIRSLDGILYRVEIEDD